MSANRDDIRFLARFRAPRRYVRRSYPAPLALALGMIRENPQAVARFNERFGRKPISKRAQRRARGKAKRRPVDTLPDGLWRRDGRVMFECQSCGAATEWEHDVEDFDFTNPFNLCGGSPRCCP